jgi:hypothetical protein
MQFSPFVLVGHLGKRVSFVLMCSLGIIPSQSVVPRQTEVAVAFGNSPIVP